MTLALKVEALNNMTVNTAHQVQYKDCHNIMSIIITPVASTPGSPSAHKFIASDDLSGGKPGMPHHFEKAPIELEYARAVMSNRIQFCARYTVPVRRKV